MFIQYKTLNMGQPKFYYQKCADTHGGKVALMAQFIPTFESPNDNPEVDLTIHHDGEGFEEPPIDASVGYNDPES